MKMTGRLVILFVMFLGALCSCTYLRENELAVVDYKSDGDFGSISLRITLYTRNDSAYASLEKAGKPVQEKAITNVQLKSFDGFLTSFKGIDKGGLCTSSISCTIQTQKERISKKDISCSWNGFDNFMASLGFKIE